MTLLHTGSRLGGCTGEGQHFLRHGQNRSGFCGVGDSVGFRFSFGGSFGVGVASIGFDSVAGCVESSGVGCLLLRVGRPGAPSSEPFISPALDALAFDRRRSCALTRLNSEVLMTYSSCSGKRAARASDAARRSAGAGWSAKILAIVPGFFLFLASSFSNMVARAVGS